MMSYPASFLRFLVRSLLLVIFILVYLFPALWFINYRQGQATKASLRSAEAASNHVATAFLWLFGVRVRPGGEPAEAPVLVAANHISWLDILVLYSVCAMSFVGKAEIDGWPLMGFMARTGGTIFHRRGSHDSATDAVLLMVDRLNAGNRVAIFPEGGVLPGTDIHVFHARMFRAAVDAACPVQPVMIRYLRGGRRDDDMTFRVGEGMGANLVRLLARPGVHADVRFLPVIDATGQPRRRLAEMAREMVSTYYDSPPGLSGKT